MRHTLYLDFETRSEVDISKAGGWVYTRDPSTEPLLMSYALDEAPVAAHDHYHDGGLPVEVRELLSAPEVGLVAHNAQFDRWVLLNVLGIETEVRRWRCTMAKAYTLGLPGRLEMVGSALGLDAEGGGKIKDGKRLIRKFCAPQPSNRKARWITPDDAPEDWQRFIEYAIRDTDLLRRVDRALPNWNYRGEELALWHLDQLINDRGLPTDQKLAKAAAQLCDDEVARLDAELVWLTEGAVESHAQIQRLLAWCNGNGARLRALRKSDVAQELERDELPANVRRALEIRQQVGRTSTAKYVAFGRCADRRDHRIRGSIQYGGAQRTLRWAGRLIQPQNFTRPTIKDTDTAAKAILDGWADVLYDDAMEVASSTLRSVVCASRGHRLVVGDYSNIEGRMLAWLAGEEWKLEAFRAFDRGKGHDLYKLAYAKSFHTPVEEVTDEQRFIGKTQELACGYQGGPGALQAMAANLGAHLPVEECPGIVQAWRKAHPRIVAFWYALERTAVAAVRAPGKPFAVEGAPIAFRVLRDWLLCRLPSGRFLCYFRPKLTADGVLQYEGVSNGKWVSVDTYGGKLSENVTQAASRDVLAYNMPLAEQASYPIVFTVHDEIVTEVRKNHGSAAGLQRAMSHIPPWAEGLPLAVSAYEAKRYRK